MSDDHHLTLEPEPDEAAARAFVGAEPEPDEPTDAQRFDAQVAELLAEPELRLHLEPEPEPEPELVPPFTAPVFEAVAPLVQVLPADFPLPTLIRFVPDPKYRDAVTEAAAVALAVDVRDAEGVQAADAALDELRARIRAVAEHFDEPRAIANRLHKALTSTCNAWTAAGEVALQTVGRRIYAEQQRLDLLAQEARRRAQAEADRIAREVAAKNAAEAAAAQAPAEVVEELQQRAATAKAAPVDRTAAPKLASSALTKAWTCTITGTPRDAEQNPCMADLTPEQRRPILNAMQAVLDGKLPLVVFDINWTYLKKRAKADEAAFAIVGFEAYDAGGIRAKGRKAVKP